jgi:hypothetical protein
MRPRPVPTIDPGRDIMIEDLPEEEQKILQKKKAAIDKFFADKVSARYKIEVQFGKGRSIHKHFPGSLHCYRSGSALSGGGDEILYPCPDDKCMGYMEPEQVSIGFALCPKCGRKWGRVSDLQEGRLFRLSHQDWARVILKAFAALGHNADIYLKSHPEDIRDKALLEQLKQRKGDEYRKVYEARVYVMYPLARIVDDSRSGRDLYKMFLSFVLA